MKTKIYKSNYESPEFTIDSVRNSDILTSSPGVDTPIVDEDEERRK